MTGAKFVEADALKTWLSDGRELALLDVREHGQYGERHLFFAIPVPYSIFELRLPVLVPNPGVRMVLYDDGDGVAERAAKRAMAAGYSNVHILPGGAAPWERAEQDIRRARRDRTENAARHGRSAQGDD